VTFLSVLFFSSGTRPGRTVRLIFMFEGSNDVLSRKEVRFGDLNDRRRHLGEICPNP